MRFVWLYGALELYHQQQGGLRFAVVFGTIALLNMTGPTVAAIEAWYLAPPARS